jgi:hypothetical protein
MSKYGLTQTVLREEKYLVEALKEMGYEVEVHPEGVPLNSYYSEQEAKAQANIIIRRHICVEPAAILDSHGSRTVGSP